MAKLNDTKLKTCLKCKKITFLKKYFFTYKMCEKCIEKKQSEREKIFRKKLSRYSSENF
jgi:hypothetical protein